MAWAALTDVPTVPVADDQLLSREAVAEISTSWVDTDDAPTHGEANGCVGGIPLKVSAAPSGF
jgi:hypothetical protein